MSPTKSIKSQPVTWAAVAMALTGLGTQAVDLATSRDDKHAMINARQQIALESFERRISEREEGARRRWAKLAEHGEQLARIEAILDSLAAGNRRAARKALPAMRATRVEPMDELRRPGPKVARPEQLNGDELLQRMEALYEAD